MRLFAREMIAVLCVGGACSATVVTYPTSGVGSAASSGSGIGASSASSGAAGTQATMSTGVGGAGAGGVQAGTGGGAGDGPAIMPAFADFACGMDHGCALKKDGTLWCWGNNAYGQLGDGTTTEEHKRVQVAVLTNVVKVVATESRSCAIQKDGALWCWGKNDEGQLGDGTTTDRPLPEQVLINGSVAAFQSVAAGYHHTCGLLKADQSLWCWGTLASYGYGLPLAPAPFAVDQEYGLETAAGTDAFECTRRLDHVVGCWGADDGGQLGNGIQSHWGSHDVAELGKDNVALYAGSTSACGLQADGSLWCWGYGANDYPNSNLAPAAMTLPGAVVMAAMSAWGEADSYWGHICVLGVDGTLWCRGPNAHGQLGDGTLTENTTFGKVAALGNNVAAVAAGGEHTCARTKDGALWCWGRNDHGQLGDGTTQDSAVPVKVLGDWP